MNLSIGTFIINKYYFKQEDRVLVMDQYIVLLIFIRCFIMEKRKRF